MADPLPVVPARENLQTVVESNTIGGRVSGDETVSIDSLFGGISTSQRAQDTVADIMSQMSGSKGYIERLIVDQDGKVIEGAHRLEALRRLGISEVPITRIVDPTANLDLSSMRKAIEGAGKIPSDHVNQIMSQVGEMLTSTGNSPEKVLEEYTFPEGYEKYFGAALDSVADEFDPNKITDSPATVGWGAGIVTPEMQRQNPVWRFLEETYPGQPTETGLIEYTIDDEAAISLVPTSPKTLKIDSLRALKKNTGAGTRALNLLSRQADKHGVTLEGLVHKFEGEGLSKADLMKFYQKAGWELRYPDKVERSLSEGKAIEDIRVEMLRSPRPTERSNLPALLDAASTASQLPGGPDEPRPKGRLRRGIGSLRKAPWFALAQMAWSELSPEQREAVEDYAKQAYERLEAGEASLSADIEALPPLAYSALPAPLALLPVVRKVVAAAQTRRRDFPMDAAGGLEWVKDFLGFGDQESSGVISLPDLQKYVATDEKSRMARAEQQGFGSEIYYHGTAVDISEFDLNHPDRKDQGWLGTGVYMTDSPYLASSYSIMSPGDSRNVIPLRVRLKNPYYATLEEKQKMMLRMHNKSKVEAREIADAWTADLQERGYDAVILQYDPKDVGEVNVVREVVVFDPKNIRSSFAKFDPAQSKEAGLSKAAGGFIDKPLYEDARVGGMI
jgi:hypothetical protein